MSCREKLDALTRKFYDTGTFSFISDVRLLLVDEVHLLAESRGAVLEAGVVCRLKALSGLPQMAGTNLASLRYVAGMPLALV